jgi:AcrR family transcriptional regulator
MMRKGAPLAQPAPLAKKAVKRKPGRNFVQPDSKIGKLFDQAAVKSQVTDATLVQRRREQIVAAAVDLFSKQGYYKTTIQEIARKAGVSTGLIYQYAQNKDDVLLLSLMSVMETYKREIPQHSPLSGDPLESLWSSFATYCRVVDRSRDAAVLAYRSTMSLPKEQREFIKRAEVDTNELIARHVRDSVEAGFFRDLNVDLVTYQLVLYAHTWALKYWRISQFATIDDYISEGFDFFIRAMATPEGLEHYRILAEKRANSASKAKRTRVRATG